MPLLVAPLARLMLKASSILCCWALVSTKVVVPSARRAAIDLVASAALGRLLVSRSAKVKLPESLSLVVSVMLPLTSTAVVVGPSLVPLMVSAIVRSPVPPELSVARTV